jgi:hypothetical protein
LQLWVAYHVDWFKTKKKKNCTDGSEIACFKKHPENNGKVTYVAYGQNTAAK